MPAARATATTNASMHQAVTSSTAAQVMATAPTWVLCRLRSVRMRASTGNAVMLIAAPMNSATEVKRIAGACVEQARVQETASAPPPSRNGAMMLAWLMTTAACPRLRISLGSSSSPMRNRKKITPTWLRALSILHAGGREDRRRTGAGKSQPEQAGPEHDAGDHLAHDLRLADADEQHPHDPAQGQNQPICTNSRRIKSVMCM